MLLNRRPYYFICALSLVLIILACRMNRGLKEGIVEVAAELLVAFVAQYSTQVLIAGRRLIGREEIAVTYNCIQQEMEQWPPHLPVDLVCMVIAT